MLHTEFRGNWLTGSGEEDFLSVFTIYGLVGHLGHVIEKSPAKFQCDYPRRHQIKFQLDR